MYFSQVSWKGQSCDIMLKWEQVLNQRPLNNEATMPTSLPLRLEGYFISMGVDASLPETRQVPKTSSTKVSPPSSFSKSFQILHQAAFYRFIASPKDCFGWICVCAINKNQTILVRFRPGQSLKMYSLVGTGQLSTVVAFVLLTQLPQVRFYSRDLSNSTTQSLRNGN